MSRSITTTAITSDGQPDLRGTERRVQPRIGLRDEENLRALVVARVLLAHGRDDGLHARLRLLDRHAVSEPRQHLQEIRAALLEPIAIARHDLAELHERHVEGRRNHRHGTFEVRPHDANDRVPLPVQRHRSADDLRIAAQEALPRTVADDRDGGARRDRHPHRSRTSARAAPWRRGR
jgi:hypothetical protein